MLSEGSAGTCSIRQVFGGSTIVASGVYLNTSDFVRDAIRDKLAAIKTIKYRDIDYNTAKKEVMGYFQERREAYPSEIERGPGA